jgi:hypothetical protein
MWFIDFYLEIHEKLCWQRIYEKTFLFSYTVVFEIVLLYIYSVIYSTPSDYYYKQNTTFKFIRKWMYLVYTIDQIHYFFNELKKWFFFIIIVTEENIENFEINHKTNRIYNQVLN